jgi:hypothetical protein
MTDPLPHGFREPYVPIVGEVREGGRVYLRGPEDRPRELTLTLPATEYANIVRLRDTMWPGQSLEMVARKLVQDGLIQCGLLELPKRHRSKGARKAEAFRGE